MATKQINLKLAENLFESAQRYIKNFGFRNIQELATESIREKIFERNEYDENFNEEEIKLVDDIIKTSILKKKLVSEEEIIKVLS